MNTANTSKTNGHWTSPRVARAFMTIALVLEIEGLSRHRVHALRRAADGILTSPLSIEEICSHPEQVQGVGPETVSWIHALQSTGVEELLRCLGATLPASVGELTRIPGIGPKSAYVLAHENGIYSIPDLSSALTSDRSQHIAGFGTNRLARLRRDVRVLMQRLEWKPVAVLAPLSAQLVDVMHTIPGILRASVTGDLRRFNVESREIRIIAAVESQRELQNWLKQWAARETEQGYEFVLETQSDRVPVQIEVTSNRTYANRLMETTGDETHQGVVVGLLQKNGVTWTENGLQSRDGDILTPETEEEIYELISLPWLPPEVREGRGILCNPHELVSAEEIRGDLHVHSNWSDGDLSIAEIAQYADSLGYEYVAITDHSQSLTIANGLTPERLRLRRAEIKEVAKRSKVKILDGIEVDILSNGSLDLPDDALAELDIVIASVHSSMQQSKQQMTQRILRAITNPYVHIIGHLTGRIIGRRSGYELDFEQIFEEASKNGVMIELNANPNRLDLWDEMLRKATAAGILIPIDTDTHHAHEFGYMNYGIRMAHRGWLKTSDVPNTLSYPALAKLLKRRRNSNGGHSEE